MKGKSAAKAPPQLPQRMATAQEIEHGIKSLKPHDLLRLATYAQNRISTIGPYAANGRSNDDLLQEAVIRLLDGRRHWFPENVDIVKYLIRAIESIASEWAAYRKRNSSLPQYAALESELVKNDGEGNPVSPFSNIGGEGSLNAEEQAIAQDIEAERKDFADEIESTCATDESASMVIIGFQSGMNGPAIQEDLGWTETEYRTTVRRIQRRAQKISERRYGR